MKISVCLAGVLALIASTVLAEEPDTDTGLVGVTFSQKSSVVRRIFEEQAARPAPGGELNTGIYIKSQERLAKTFEQPIPDELVESTRD